VCTLVVKTITLVVKTTGTGISMWIDKDKHGIESEEYVCTLVVKT